MDEARNLPERPVLLMLHGGGPGVDAASNWRGVHERLSADFDCWAPDLLGFGSLVGRADPRPVGPVAWARRRARQIVALMDERRVEGAVVLGNSAAGGAAALAMMQMAPARVRRAVVMGGGGTAPLPPGVPFYDAGTREAMRAALGKLVADPRDHAEMLDELADERFARAMVPGAEADFRAMFAADPPDARPVDLARIPCPVLALHGEHDRVLPPSVSRELADRLPRGEWAVVGGAGHWIHVDRPVEFCDRVRDFLAQ